MKAKVILGKEEYEFDTYKATRGPTVVDFSKFYPTTGYFALDAGYTSTASCKSDITYIDGGKGELVYRGEHIDELSKEAFHILVSKYVVDGKKPSKKDAKELETEIVHHYMNLDEDMKNLITIHQRSAHPMSIISSCFNLLSTKYYHLLGKKSDEVFDEYFKISLGQTAGMVANIHRHISGRKLIDVDYSKGYVENFLTMFRSDNNGVLAEPLKKEEITAVEKFLILHIDHEQNASTSVLRGTLSTEAHIFSSMSAAVNALFGKAHGGANEAVMNQLDLIGDVSKVDDYVAKVKKKEAKLMGFGHRVYKNYDPRAKELAKTSKEMLKVGIKLDKDKLEIANKLEAISLNDAYFKERNLYPNVDFYSGIVLSALHVPMIMFTPFFVLGRVPGWVAHSKEFLQSDEFKIARPRQLYLGK